MKQFRHISDLDILLLILDARLRHLHRRFLHWLRQQTEEQLGMMALGAMCFLLGCQVYLWTLGW